MSTSAVSIQQLSINTIRTLSMDAVQQANSGHPGTPMALAPVAYSLWSQVLRYDPRQPLWPGRDRFVLSCGHASMLLYSTLHVAGVRRTDKAGKVTDQEAISLDDIRNFRQWGSPCAGHPEYHWATGVETTTGPLGQGVATSVGMALAERWLADHFNQPGYELFNYNIYAVCSDGDLMEGISQEAASLAGHLRLPNLCWIYDNNGITIDGQTNLAYSDDVRGRFESLGWQVLHVKDANDLDALGRAYQAFLDYNDGPTLIIVDSVIACGAPNAHGTSAAHGAPLGEEEIRLTKAGYGWPEDAKFLVPDEVLEHFQETLGQRGAELSEAWTEAFAGYEKQHPELAAEWKLIAAGKLPEDWDAEIPTYPTSAKGMASRASGGEVLGAIGKRVPWLLGGAADLVASTKTSIKGGGDFRPGGLAGRNIHFGIREHGMAAAANGLALAGLRPFVSTFMVFSDYLRPAARLSCIMDLPVLYIYTHDSVGVGEDGPTHQPIEHLAALRAMPHMIVLRPGDANEVAEAYRVAMQLHHRPTSIVLTRQNLPTLDREKFAPASGVTRGGYVLADAADGKPQVILIATGSELSLAVEAYEQLTAEGIQARVVSMPSFELFAEQDAAYREAVLPAAVTARVGIELGCPMGWDRWLGFEGRFIGMRSFGASAPYERLLEEFGITQAAVVKAAKELL